MLSVTETETMAAYMKPPSKKMGTGGNDEDNKALVKGFVVRDAPWNAQGNKVYKNVYHSKRLISCCHYHCHINDFLFLLFATFRHQTWAVPKSSPHSDLESHRNTHLHGDPKSAKWKWYAQISGTREQEHSIFLLLSFSWCVWCPWRSYFCPLLPLPE